MLSLGKMALHLEKKANRVGLRTNTSKTKAFSLIGYRMFPIYIIGRISKASDGF